MGSCGLCCPHSLEIGKCQWWIIMESCQLWNVTKVIKLSSTTFSCQCHGNFLQIECHYIMKCHHQPMVNPRINQSQGSQGSYHQRPLQPHLRNICDCCAAGTKPLETQLVKCGPKPPPGRGEGKVFEKTQLVNISLMTMQIVLDISIAFMGLQRLSHSK